MELPRFYLIPLDSCVVRAARDFYFILKLGEFFGKSAKIWTGRRKRSRPWRHHAAGGPTPHSVRRLPLRIVLPFPHPQPQPRLLLYVAFDARAPIFRFFRDQNADTSQQQRLKKGNQQEKSRGRERERERSDSGADFVQQLAGLKDVRAPPPLFHLPP